MKEYQLQRLEEIRVDYIALYKDCIDPPVFYHIAFIHSFEEINQTEVIFFSEYENKKLIQTLPILKNGDQYSNLTHSGWDNLSIIGNKYSSGNRVRLLQEFLKIYGNLVLYNFRSNPHINGIDELCWETLHFRCPYIRLPQTVEKLLDDLSKKFKRNVRYQNNLCAREGVRFNLFRAIDLSVLERTALLEQLFDLHQKRFGTKDVESQFVKNNSRRFHDQLILGNETSNAFFMVAKKSENPIGILYGFCSSQRMVYFNSGIDPEFSKLSLGVVLVFKSIEWAINNKIVYFDFLRGTEKYKKLWTSENEENYTYYLRNGEFINRSRISKLYFQNSSNRLGRKKAFINSVKMFFKSYS